MRRIQENAAPTMNTITQGEQQNIFKIHRIDLKEANTMFPKKKDARFQD